MATVMLPKLAPIKNTDICTILWEMSVSICDVLPVAESVCVCVCASVSECVLAEMGR